MVGITLAFGSMLEPHCPSADDVLQRACCPYPLSPIPALCAYLWRGSVGGFDLDGKNRNCGSTYSI